MKWNVHYGIDTRSGFLSFGFVEVDAENCIEAYGVAEKMQPNPGASKWLADRNLSGNIGVFDLRAEQFQE